MDLVEEKPPTSKQYVCFWECQITTARNVLNSLLKTHGASLTDESLQTLLTEVEAILDSRPLTIDDISDVASVVVPLKTTNLLTMKSRIVMPPPGVFLLANVYCKKHWRQVEHLSNKFRSTIKTLEQAEVE